MDRGRIPVPGSVTSQLGEAGVPNRIDLPRARHERAHRKLVEHDEPDGRRSGDVDVRREVGVREDRRRAEERDEGQYGQDQGEREEEASRTPACIRDDSRNRQYERSE